jgi:hypothetical protein
MTLVALAAAASLALWGAAQILALRRLDTARVAEPRSAEARPHDALSIQLRSRCAGDPAPQLELAEHTIRADRRFSWNDDAAACAPARLDRIAEADDQVATEAALDRENRELAEDRRSLKRILAPADQDQPGAPRRPHRPPTRSELQLMSRPPSTTFKALGPAGLTIEGKISHMSVDDDGTTITIVVPLGDVSTGVTLRDTYAKKALDVAAYPTASLRVRRSALTFPAAHAESSGDAKGSLTLHGQTRDVSFHYSAKLNRGTYEVEGSTRINVDDYGVERPTYLGVTVKPDVDVTTAFQLDDVR